MDSFRSFILLGLVIAVNFVESNKTDVLIHEQNISHFDLLIDGLEREIWPEDEKPCFDAMTLMLNSAKNSTLWAIWMLDSIQLPTGQLYGVKLHLGNYDECMNPHNVFKTDDLDSLTQYCTADVDLVESVKRGASVLDYNVSVDTYIGTTTKFGSILSDFIWGACLPRVCQPHSVPKVLRVFLQNSRFSSFSEKARISVTKCDVPDTLRQRQIGNISLYIFLSTILTLTVIVIGCTYYLKVKKNVFSNRFVGELVRSFCLERNVKSLTNVRDNEIYSLNFLRLITAFLLVLGHHVLGLYTITGINMLGLEEVMVIYGANLHVDILVDTFLTVSGLLFMRGLLMDKAKNPLIYIWKRYVRLVICLAVLIFFMASSFYYLGDGPIWCTGYKDHESCANYPWINLLMLANFDVRKMCVISTWYIACDFQLCVMCTFMFMVYKRNKRLGIYTYITVFLVGAAIPGIITYWRDLPVVVFDGVQSMTDMRKNVLFTDVFMSSYCRMGSYFVGMGTGYIFYNYKPSEYRNTISKKWSFTGLITSLLLMHGVLEISLYYFNNRDPIGAAIYVSTNRIVWATAICIIACVSEYGNLSILNNVFEWPPLVPLSRLLYGLYVTHVPVLLYIHTTTRTLLADALINVYVDTIGVTVICLGISLVIWLLFEAPIININNLLLDKTWKSTNNINKQNDVALEERKTL